MPVHKVLLPKTADAQSAMSRGVSCLTAGCAVGAASAIAMGSQPIGLVPMFVNTVSSYALGASSVGAVYENQVYKMRSRRFSYFASAALVLTVASIASMKKSNSVSAPVAALTLVIAMSGALTQEAYSLIHIARDPELLGSLKELMHTSEN